MAENKNSILVYADWINKFEKLTDEEAGKLIKHFFRYVNDLKPVAPDRITELLFVDIEQSLKRDLIKWEEVKVGKSQNGSMGNLKRWNKDLYDKVIAEELTTEEATRIAKDRKTSLSDKIETGATDEVANIAVSVSVSDIKNNINNPAKAEPIDFDKFIKVFNGYGNRNFRVTEKVKLSLRARLKDYKKEEVMRAIANAHKDQYHKETNFKYLTPEFILRPDKLEKFLNLPLSGPTSLGYTPHLPN